MSTVLGNEADQLATPQVFSINATYSYGEKIVSEMTTIDLRPYKESMAPPSVIADELEKIRKQLEKVTKIKGSGLRCTFGLLTATAKSIQNDRDVQPTRLYRRISSSAIENSLTASSKSPKISFISACGVSRSRAVIASFSHWISKVAFSFPSTSEHMNLLN